MNPRLWLSICLLAFSLIACSDKRGVNMDLTGLNYTNAWISTFSVNGYHGGGISPNGGGGSFVCCVTVPRKWQPGMKVTVRWTNDDRVDTGWKERVVPVPEYTENDLGGFFVHFYPDDSVKVLVSTKMEGHPDYPYPRPK